jgi:hypothetical protein
LVSDSAAFYNATYKYAYMCLPFHGAVNNIIIEAESNKEIVMTVAIYNIETRIKPICQVIFYNLPRRGIPLTKEQIHSMKIEKSNTGGPRHITFL